MLNNLKITLAAGQINFCGEISLSLHERINLRGENMFQADVCRLKQAGFWGNFCPKTGELYVNTAAWGVVISGEQFPETLIAYAIKWELEKAGGFGLFPEWEEKKEARENLADRWGNPSTKKMRRKIYGAEWKNNF